MTHPKKVDFIENNHESRITRLEVTIENINKTLDRMEKRFDRIDERFDKIDNRLWQMMFFMVSAFGGVFIMLAKIKGWL